uniref:Uncharacterized protein n=1 Tax=Arundo donax TaxID=35708 RepID=A0A0A9H1V5_ARUDO
MFLLGWHWLKQNRPAISCSMHKGQNVSAWFIPVLRLLDLPLKGCSRDFNVLFILVMISEITWHVQPR